ncbi:MAG: hypothetical protein ACOY94_06695 [Bacillota bacterium]
MESNERFEAELSRALKQGADDTKPSMDIRGYVMSRVSRQGRLRARLGILLQFAGAACLIVAALISVGEPISASPLTRAVAKMGA